MARAKWKGLYYNNTILKCAIFIKVKKPLKGKNKVIFNKSLAIPKLFLGYKFNIYKGFFFRNFYISRFVLGYKFGEFSFTRKPFKYVLKSKSSETTLKR